MKRFAIFAGDSYYPAGGWDDFQSSYANLSEAVGAVVKLPKTSYFSKIKIGNDTFDWYHIVDLHTGEQVKSELLEEGS